MGFFLIKYLYLHMELNGGACFLQRKFGVLGLPQGGFCV